MTAKSLARHFSFKSRLAKHLVWVVILKIIVLYGLWYCFIRPNKVQVQVEQLYNPKPSLTQGVQP